MIASSPWACQKSTSNERSISSIRPVRRQSYTQNSALDSKSGLPRQAHHPTNAYMDLVGDQVSGGGYISASEYVRELLRPDQNAKAKNNLRRCCLKAEVGTGDRDTFITAQNWSEILP